MHSYLNHNIALTLTHPQVVSELTAWPGPGLRRISINSFGFGGANAHAILDDAYNSVKGTESSPTLEVDGGFNGKHHTDTFSSPTENGYHQQEELIKSPQIFILSSHYEGGSNAIAQSLASYLAVKAAANPDNAILYNLSYTLSERRSKFLWRSSVIATSIDELQRKLETHPPNPIKSSSRSLAFVFSGQGAQWAKMGSELMVFDSFRGSIESACAYFKVLGCTWSLIGMLSSCFLLDIMDGITNSYYRGACL